MVGRSAQDRQDGRELGEHSLLDVDFIIPSEEEPKSEGTEQPDVDSHGASLRREVNSLEEELNSKNESIVLTRDGMNQA